MPSKVEDQLAIMQLITRYYRVIDKMDFDGWAACFSENGRFEGAFADYDAHRDLDRFRSDAQALLGK